MHSWLITMLKYIKYLYFHVFFVQCVVDLRLQGSSNVWVLPEYSQEFPLNCAHLFCGAFSAWERAISGCYNISTSAYNNRYQLIGTKRLCRCGNWEHVRPFSKPLSATMWLFMILKRESWETSKTTTGWTFSDTKPIWFSRCHHHANHGVWVEKGKAFIHQWSVHGSRHQESSTS